MLDGVLRWLNEYSAALQSIGVLILIFGIVWSILKGAPQSVRKGFVVAARGMRRRWREAVPTSLLDRLIEEGDAIAQQLEQDRQTPAYEPWRAAAEKLLAEHFPSYLTDFKTARVPKRLPGGAHTEEIWRPLKRVWAQLEVLREIKRDARRSK